MVALPVRQLPNEIVALQALALDLRWTWSHEADTLWRLVDRDLWEQTHDPWVVLQSAPDERFKMLATDSDFQKELSGVLEARKRYLTEPGWFRRTAGAAALGGVAYFSMEFGLGAVLPLYAGGLGVLAGDFLKTASDLDVPIIGVGLLYQEGYFRQIIDAGGTQQEFYPYNEPAAMPIEPVILPQGGWLRIGLELPGRIVHLRVWQATVGRVKLYLLDSNDVLNSPPDRGITAKLYGGGAEMRLIQEIVLGVGGWRVVAALQPDTDICHVNEGHAAFAILERARHLALTANLDFWEALWATRAGNVFTTHTPVAAGFDQFHPDLLRKYLPYVHGVLAGQGIELDDVLALGRADSGNADEPFNMAFLAQRGSAKCIAVSRLHAEVSRLIFQPLFPRWPSCEIPVTHITNGVHVPTWDSVEADRVWTECCGKERWRLPPDTQSERMDGASDEELWSMRGEGRRRMVIAARQHLSRHLRERGLDPEAVARADTVLDANVLTIGFARRFTEYKRPNLLLRDRERLSRMLLDERRPVQIVIAGKAHPADLPGKEMILQWLNLAREPQYRRQVVFLEDYDITLAQELVQGVDVWINTPRRPWEACGTSGMKVLVNGGLNCSILDGWWDEAYERGVGWAIGDRAGGPIDEVDTRDAAGLYRVLEENIIPEFYSRDSVGLPRAWIGRIRESMSKLTPRFGGARMVRDYVQDVYLPLAQAVRARSLDGFASARDMNKGLRTLHGHWASLHIGDPTITWSGTAWHLAVPITLGEVPTSSVSVEVFAEATAELQHDVIRLDRERPIPGTTNGFVYAGAIESSRPVGDYTVRVVVRHPDAFLPSEMPLITWRR